MPVIIEPFRIKSVEPLKQTTREEREVLLKEASYNLFLLKSDDVLIDLLTDSGTGAMSSKQWAAIQKGDESYAGSSSYFFFEKSVKNLMPFKHVIPTHQGRAAERILFSTTLKKGDIVPNNTHFDTTRANVEAREAIAIDLPLAEASSYKTKHPFKGNMNLEALQNLLAEKGDKIPLVMSTITNNSGGGQPVSLENIRRTAEICRKFKKPFFLDSCRFAENSYFIKLREEGYGHKSVVEIVREIFSYADGMTMSGKKDALSNMGGWLALNDDSLAEEAKNHLILSEGFPTYGGLSGRDIHAMAEGLKEVVKENYLQYRLASAAYLGQALVKIGLPVVEPFGAHAIFIDAKALLPHIKPLQYPGHALAVELYREAGIRSCEIGSVMFGKQPDGSEKAANLELVRLALPRRVYTQSHIDYVIQSFEAIYKRRAKIPAYSITWQPKSLRHFSCHFKSL